MRDERHARGVNTPSHLLDLRLGDLPARAALQWGSEQAVHFIEPNGTIQSETYTEFADNVDRVETLPDEDFLEGCSFSNDESALGTTSQ